MAYSLDVLYCLYVLYSLDVLYHTMPHSSCRFEVNDVHSLQCLKDVNVLLFVLRRQ